MKIHRRHGLTGAGQAIGATAVIDTFRAFTTAAFAQAGGVGTHLLVATLDQARSLRTEHPTALVCGEDRGVTPPDFDLGNSPAEILGLELDGKTLIQRTSAGTRCVIAALGSEQATIVYPTSLVVASATAGALLGSNEITLVASGRFGTEPATEDDLTADFIASVVEGSAEPNPSGTSEAVRSSDSALRLESSQWAHLDDVALCSDIDRFDFAMRADMRPDGSALLQRVDIPGPGG